MGRLRDVQHGAGAIWVSSDVGLNRLDDAGWALFEGLPAGGVHGLYVSSLAQLSNRLPAAQLAAWEAAGRLAG